MQKIRSTFITLVILLLPMNWIYAAPISCPAVKTITANNYLLNTSKNGGPQLFVIHNLSHATVLLNHPLNRDPGAKAGWASEIKPNHWSALLLNSKNFLLNCSSGKKVHLVNCSKFIRVCEPDLKLDPALSGNYWFVENQTEANFWPAILKRAAKNVKVSKNI